MKEVKKCKWCDKEIVGLRSDVIFCRRACKNKINSLKNQKELKRYLVVLMKSLRYI
jgi:hypothetical protein